MARLFSSMKYTSNGSPEEVWERAILVKNVYHYSAELLSIFHHTLTQYNIETLKIISMKFVRTKPIVPAKARASKLSAVLVDTIPHMVVSTICDFNKVLGPSGPD